MQVLLRWMHAQPDQALFCALAALLCAHLASALSLSHYQSQAAALGRRALAQLGGATTGDFAAGFSCLICIVTAVLCRLHADGNACVCAGLAGIVQGATLSG
jgi:hypothetical protein